MIISFDLDDTLIPSTKEFLTEKQNILHKLLGIEKIRLGTIKLIEELRQNGHQIYVYTTSMRSEFKIKFFFFSYGMSVDFVINQQKHKKEVRGFAKNSSKFPPTFGIDVHIDDSFGVQMEGEKYGFKTIIIDFKNVNWTKTIVENLTEIQSKSRIVPKTQ